MIQYHNPYLDSPQQADEVIADGVANLVDSLEGKAVLVMQQGHLRGRHPQHPSSQNRLFCPGDGELVNGVVGAEISTAALVTIRHDAKVQICLCSSEQGCKASCVAFNVVRMRPDKQDSLPCPFRRLHGRQNSQPRCKNECQTEKQHLGVFLSSMEKSCA
jgi:hypothetical protein